MIDLNKLVTDCGNDKIEAIKILSATTNLDLKEAKNIIDKAYEMKKTNPKSDTNALLNPSTVNIPKYTNKISPKKQINYGPVVSIWNVNRTKILRYQKEIWHDGLKEHKVISATDKDILENKVRVQVNKWNEKWTAICEKKLIEAEIKASNEEAENRTLEAELKLSEVENILLSSLDINDVVDWEVLKNKDNFKVHAPMEPSSPKHSKLPPKPDKNALEFQPKLTLFSKIFKFLRDKAVVKSDTYYKTAYEDWQIEYERILTINNQLTTEYKKALDAFNKELKKWQYQKTEYLKKQNQHNAKIDELKSQYFSHNVSAILEYCEIVLNHSSLPSFVHKDFEFDYNPASKILIIDYMLPNIEDFPNVKEVKFIASRKDLKVTYQTSNFMEKLFDSTIYKLILRILHEEFEADVANAIDAISLNGWVNYLNKATGKHEVACITSIQVKKVDFDSIDLRNVDAKACFKNLKGVGSSKLAGIIPIKPILTINKNDKRFINSYNVTNTLDDSTNLAAIPWEDFEHLIRELFENEFSSNGGEVKVTQASRDGGVDAVAFDPDPIRGGKIVIQAKRYTNTVGVSAVLYMEQS